MTRTTWEGAPPPAPRPRSFADNLRFVRRVVPIVTVLAVGLPLLLIARLPERALFGLHRPVTPFLTVAVCRICCWLASLRREVTGTPMRHAGAFVANHVSWMDILVLNAGKRLYFVAKEEVSGWSGIGWLARATGTVFIRRDRAQAAKQTQVFEDRLIAGHKLLFFPEGTSTDGQSVLPFKTTLFAAFFADRLRDRLWVQPVTLRYHGPEGSAPQHYGWWGDMELLPSFVQIFSARGRGRVEVIYHTPLKVSEAETRKTLARDAEAAVRLGLEDGRMAR